jgi:diadenosine tetraphosphate (Ap4A) HIT family hydrolase
VGLRPPLDRILSPRPNSQNTSLRGGRKADVAVHVFSGVNMILHPQLKKDCHVLGALPLSAVLLLNDTRYPWVVLVPQREQVREWIDLNETDRQQLLLESCQVQEALRDLYHPEKLNVGLLGNIVPQLHLHHIARFTTDPAWPGPVWGHSKAEPYTDLALQQRSADLKAALGI